MHGSYQLSVKIQTPWTQSQLELKISWDLVDKHAYCAPLNRSPPDFWDILHYITLVLIIFFVQSHANTSEVDLGVNWVEYCAPRHI